jgi:hypothetical protein
MSDGNGAGNGARLRLARPGAPLGLGCRPALPALTGPRLVLAQPGQ